MNEALLDILACPLCKGRLVYHKEQSELWCRADKLAYPMQEGMPVMLEEQARKLSLTELDAS